MFESTIIRIMVYLIGFYTLVAGVQQVISTNVFGYTNWVTNAVPSEFLANGIMALSLPLAVLIIAAAFYNRRRILMFALGSSFTYQFGAAVINAIDTVGLGSPAVPALFIGLFAAVMWGYIKVQPQGLVMESDNSIDGYKIIQEDDGDLDERVESKV